ncbi:MAG: hypothetical protein LBV36_01995, partial [Chromatiales bacterium]|nr:hypothetical protein [Chromatiales bacterium]
MVISGARYSFQDAEPLRANGPEKSSEHRFGISRCIKGKKSFSEVSTDPSRQDRDTFSKLFARKRLRGWKKCPDTAKAL